MLDRLRAQDGMVVLATVAVLAAFVMVPPRMRASTHVDRLQRAVLVARGQPLNADLFADEVVEGYYEGLLDPATPGSGTHAMLTGLLGPAKPQRPANWPRLHETGAVDRSAPYRRFTLRPDIDLRYHGTRLRTNQWGMRDDPVEMQPDPGVRRWVVIGASIAMGSGVEHDEIFVERLERALSEHHTGGDVSRHEVVNLSVSGYRLTQQVDVAARDVPRFNPDAVILVLSDIAVNARWWLHLVTIVSHGADLRYDWLRALVDEAGLHRGRGRNLMAERIAPYREAVLEASLRSILDSVRSTGAPIIVVTVPQPGHADVLDERLESLRAVLDEESVPVIDLLDAFDSVEDHTALWVRPYDRHPNAEGHRLLFDRLYERLLADPRAAAIVLGDAP